MRSALVALLRCPLPSSRNSRSKSATAAPGPAALNPPLAALAGPAQTGRLPTALHLGIHLFFIYGVDSAFSCALLWSPSCGARFFLPENNCLKTIPYLCYCTEISGKSQARLLKPRSFKKIRKNLKKGLHFLFRCVIISKPSRTTATE